MDIIIHFFRSYPEMAIFLTLGIGFWVGSLKYKNFSLGTSHFGFISRCIGRTNEHRYSRSTQIGIFPAIPICYRI